MASPYQLDLARWEEKNPHRIPAQTETDKLSKQAQETQWAKERAFKSKLDMAIDKRLRRRFHNLETAMRKDQRIAALFRDAKVDQVCFLQDKEKLVLLGLLGN